MAHAAGAGGDPWRLVAAVSEEAAVFLDDCAGELLHYAGGVELLGEVVGAYHLYMELNPVARDLIAQVFNVSAGCLFEKLNFCACVRRPPTVTLCWW